MNVVENHCIKVTPRLLILVSKLKETSLMSVRAVKSSIRAPATVLLFTISLIMAMDIMSMGTADRNLACESTVVPAQESTPEPTSIHAFALESVSALEFHAESSPDLESTHEPPLQPRSPQSPVQSPLQPRSPQSPLQSPLQPRSPRSPLKSLIQSRSPRSQLKSLLQFRSPRSSLKSLLQFRSPRSPLKRLLQSRSPRSPLKSLQSLLYRPLSHSLSQSLSFDRALSLPSITRFPSTRAPHPKVTLDPLKFGWGQTFL